MPYKRLPRITSVAAGEQPYTLHITWDRGGESLVDVSGLIHTFRVYAPLRDAPERFHQVRVGEYGTDIVWTDELDMSAETLWRLAQEQSGATMSADAFHAWRLQRDFTLDAAAEALGLSRRMVTYYDHGDKPIPRSVALATLGLEHRYLGMNDPRGSMFNDPIRVTQGSGNVFADMGFDDAEELQVKAGLTLHIANRIQALGLNQHQAGERLGLGEPDISKLMHCRYTGFSTERLLTLLHALDVDIDIVLRPCNEHVVDHHVRVRFIRPRKPRQSRASGTRPGTLA